MPKWHLAVDVVVIYLLSAIVGEFQHNTMEEKNAILEKKYDDMLKVYERIRENLKRCLTKVKDLYVLV
jgi:hypothetical protein